MRNISAKILRIWTSNAGNVKRHFSPSSRVDFVLKHFLSSALAALWSAKQNHFCNFDSVYEEQFCKITLNLDQWFRRCH